MTGPTPVTVGLLRAWPLPDPGGDKEAKGRVLIVGGHVEVPGATLLAAEAAMRAGAGKLQVATVSPLAIPLGICLPEARAVALPMGDDGGLAAEAADQVVELANASDVVLLGPGFLDPQQAATFCRLVIPRLEVPLVLDALGMAYLTDNLEGVAHLRGRVVLSPNLTELAETLGRHGHDIPEAARAEATLELAATTGAVVVSGAATSYIATPEGACWSEDSGGPGMGVSGSGDVKAGVVAGLLARGCGSDQAAVWGAYAHGRSGERLASMIGQRGFLARDLLPVLPQAFSELQA